MALYWQNDDPNCLEALCTRSQAEFLAAFDHHRVVVNERWGILITHHLWPLAEATEPFKLKVILNPAAKHSTAESRIRSVVMKHPSAPDAVQAVIDQMAFYSTCD